MVLTRRSGLFRNSGEASPVCSSAHRRPLTGQTALITRRRNRRVVLSQVAQIGVDSSVLSEARTYEETRTILSGAFAPAPKVLARARVIGYLDGRSVRMPRTSAMPGAPVNSAEDDLLREFFSATGKGCLEIVLC